MRQIRTAATPETCLHATYTSRFSASFDLAKVCTAERQDTSTMGQRAQQHTVYMLLAYAYPAVYFWCWCTPHIQAGLEVVAHILGLLIDGWLRGDDSAVLLV